MGVVVEVGGREGEAALMVVTNCHWVDTRECEWVMQVEHEHAEDAPALSLFTFR
jgi:hypothetical protein